MFDLSAVLGVTGPVFFIMLLGYAAVKYGWVPANSTQAFSAFAVKFALPALLFKSISEMKVSEFFDGRYLTGYAVGSLLAFGGLFAVCVFLRRKNLSHSAMFAMGGSFSNNLMIGYPIVIQLFGAAAMTPLALTLMVENFIMFPLALILADIGRGDRSNPIAVFVASVAQVFKNPIILGILFGVLCSYLGIELLPEMKKVVDMFAVTVSGVALFAIGGLLVGVNFMSVFRDISLVMLTKLIVHPLMVALVFWWLTGLANESALIAIVLASMPMFGIYPVIAQRYDLGPTCAAALVPTTVLSFVTLNVVIGLVFSVSG